MNASGRFRPTTTGAVDPAVTSRDVGSCQRGPASESGTPTGTVRGGARELGVLGRRVLQVLARQLVLVLGPGLGLPPRGSVRRICARFDREGLLAGPGGCGGLGLLTEVEAGEGVVGDVRRGQELLVG